MIVYTTEEKLRENGWEKDFMPNKMGYGQWYKTCHGDGKNEPAGMVIIQYNQSEGYVDGLVSFDMGIDKIEVVLKEIEKLDITKGVENS